MPRKNIIFNQWLKSAGWWPDYQLRLFKSGTIDWPSYPHQPPECIGKTIQLSINPDEYILHHSYPTVESMVESINRYSSIEARLIDKKQISADDILSDFHQELYRRYLGLDGVKQSTYALSVSLIHAFYQSLVSIKLLEKNGFPKHSTQLKALKAIKKSQKTINQEFQFRYFNFLQKRSAGFIKLYWWIRKKLTFYR